ncbi:hypothetical protein ABVT39_015906 [Epinephelus coioides]
MAFRRHAASACSVLSAPFAHRCDEDRQPRPAPQQSSTGPDEALHTWGVSFLVPVDHQLPAAAAATVTAEAADPAAVQQRQYTLACWFQAFTKYNMPFIRCLQEAACLHSPRAECDENKACGTKKKKSKEKIIGHRQCMEECLQTRLLSGPYD